MFQPGRLIHRITLQQPGAAIDAIGQPLDQAWSDVALLWADVRHMGGLETLKSDAPVSIVKASIRIRYRVGVNAGMRVLLGAAVYRVEAVIPVGLEWLDLACVLTT